MDKSRLELTCSSQVAGMFPRQNMPRVSSSLHAVQLGAGLFGVFSGEIKEPNMTSLYRMNEYPRSGNLSRFLAVERGVGKLDKELTCLATAVGIN